MGVVQIDIQNLNKKNNKKTRSNLFILSIAKSLDKEPIYLNFEDDCIRRIIQQFCKLASNKLYIYLILLYEQQNEFSKEPYTNQDLYRFLNAIQQGVIGNEINLNVNIDSDAYENQKKNKLIKWLKEFIHVQTQVKLDPIFLNIYYRELRNLLSTYQTRGSKKQSVLHSPLMFLNNSVCVQQYLHYKEKQLQFLFTSLLHVDYSNYIVVLLQQDDDVKNQYYLYYCDIEDNKLQLQWYGIIIIIIKLENRLNQYINDNILTECHKKASLSVKQSKYDYNQNQTQSKIIYIHSLTMLQKPSSENIRENINLDINLNTENNHPQLIKDQKQISKQLKARIVPCIVQNSPISETDFMIVGGEFQNDSSICNIIEIVKLQFSQPKYHSYILKKESLFAFNSFIPWPYMIVLANKQSPCQYIFLPGDYGNKLNCYDQPIVNIYQNYAYKLTTPKDNLKFQWQKLDIIYDNSDLHEDPKLGKVQPIPLQHFSGNQNNILCLDDSKKTSWILAKTFNQQILLGYKGKAEFNRSQKDFDSASFDDDFKQFIIVAKIHEIQNKLIVKEKFYDTNNELVQQKKVLNINNQTYQKHSTLQNEF